MTGSANHPGGIEEKARFGAYVTSRVIGRGGMGTVYEAMHPSLGKRVAVKAIKRSLVGDPVAEQRFLREARAIARLAHPHVVDVFDMGVDDGWPFIVMELLEGETLESLLLREGRLGAQGAVDVMLPVLSAVGAIHDGGLVHRDLKPGNVMLTRRGRFAIDPVILDFGISRGDSDDASSHPALTDPDVLVGTLPYMSPEQMRDSTAAAPPGDQYALGVMLYECLTGRRPFQGDRYELMHAAMTADPEAPSAIVPEIPRELDAIVLRAMRRRVSDRFPSVRALGGALLPFADRSSWKRWSGEFVGGEARAETPSGQVTEPDTRRPRSSSGSAGKTVFDRPRAGARRGPLAAVVVGGAAIAVVVGAVALRHRPETPAPAARAPVAAIPAPPPAASAPPAAPARLPEPARVAAPAAVPATPSIRARPVRPARAPAAVRAKRPAPPVDDDDDDHAIDPYAPLR